MTNDDQHVPFYLRTTTGNTQSMAVYSEAEQAGLAQPHGRRQRLLFMSMTTTLKAPLPFFTSGNK